MRKIKAPISGKTYKNVDGIELSDDSALLIDGYLDEAEGTNKRPGLSLELDLGEGSNNGIDGIYWWNNKQYAISISAGNIHKITRSAGTLSNTDLTTDTLQSDTRVTFADDGDTLYMANGGRIVYTDGTTNTAYIADGDAPTTVSHVAFLDTYILANEVGTAKFWYSSVADGLSWSAVDFASAVGDADYITALHVFNREIYLFGPNSVEVWENDGTSPFSRIPGGFHEVGCIAPYSVVNTDTSLIWLNHKKHFVELTSGGELRELVSDYDKEIQGFESVSDCMADRIEIDGKPFLVFHFPAENKTLVYNYRQQTWSEWRQYVSPSPTYNRWYGNAYAFAPAWNLHLVGARHDSLLYSMSPEYYDDAGESIRMLRRTGHIDYGTSRLKRCNELRLRLKRGGTSNTEANMMLRWRDDNGQWSNEVLISLGKIGDSEIIQRIYPRGIYRTRQYEISMTDSVEGIYVDAEEEIDLLKN